MSRTIQQLPIGTTIYLDENGNHIPYWYLGLDENNICRVIRRNTCAESKRIAASSSVAYANTSYINSEIDTWLQDTFISRFDMATQNALVETAIACAYQPLSVSQIGLLEPNGDPVINTYPRKCFLPSATELKGASTSTAPYGAEGLNYSSALRAAKNLEGSTSTYYDYYWNDYPETARSDKTSSGHTIYSGDSNSLVEYWTRSLKSVEATRSYYYYIYSYGGVSYYSRNSSIKLRPCLAINPNTPVSEEDAEYIFLLPEGRDTSWKVDIDIDMGESLTRPKRGKILIFGDSNDLVVTSLQACNNYHDSTNQRVWVDAENNMVTFGETKKSQTWNIGLKFIVEFPTPDAKLYEPIIIVQHDTE